MAVRERRSRLTLVTKFGLVSLIAVAAIGVLLGVVLQRSVRQRAIADAARTGEVAANVGVRPFLTVADLSNNFIPLDAERVVALDATLGTSLSPGGVVRLKVWNRQHWLVYSDNAALRGRWFAGSELLEQAFEGRLTSEITDLTAPEEREERDFGELLAVYVPLRAAASGEFSTDGSGEVVGAFEVYLPWSPIAADIHSDTRRLWLALALGLGVLYLSVFRLVAGASRRLRVQADENLFLASHDTLTGLFNRDAFVTQLGSGLSASASHHERSLSTASPFDVLLLFDLDGFQTVNDTLGHDRGDALLRIVGERFGGLVRAADVVARMGGDEFAVLLRHLPDQETATRLVARFLASLEQPIVLDGLSLEVRASVGAVMITDDTRPAERLLQQADIAMYAAKANQSVLEFFRPELDDFSSQALELASEVRAGIEGSHFVLYYQPKFDIATGVIVGAEALVRWLHPDRGFIAPGGFMPTVEQLPIGRDLTNFILDRAIEKLATWQQLERRLVVSVNLSARDVNDPDLPVLIAAMAEQHGADLSGLVVELTEGNALTNEARAIETLTRLRGLGCGVAVDDFGTGYASMSYLARLPATELKIDQSFVMKVLDDTQAANLVRHCVDIGHSLAMSVTAEGIETTAVLAALADLGCDTGQGYLVSRPLPDSDFEEFASTWRLGLTRADHSEART